MTRRERVDEAGVVGQMGDHPQLDLVVVGDEEATALRRNEGAPEALAFVGPDGNVVEVGPVGAQPAGAGDRLVEGGVDASVVADLG